MRLARDPARLGADRNAEQGSKRRRSSSPSALEVSAVEGKPRRRRKEQKKDKARHGKVQRDGSTIAMRREAQIGLDSAREIESSSSSGSSGEVRAHETYSSRNVLIAVVQVTSPTSWQEAVIAKWKKYARIEARQ